MAHPPDDGQRAGLPEAEPLYPPKETPWNGPVVRCVMGHLSSRAQGLDQLVLVRLATHARKGENGGGITVGRRKLAEETGISPNTVDEALGRLREAKLIERLGYGPHRTYKYRIVLCNDCQRPSSRATERSASGPVKGSQWPSGRAKTTVTTGETHSQRMARLPAEASRDAADPADDDQAPEQQPALYVVGDEPSPPTPPRARSDQTPVAAEGSVRTPATATADGRAPPAFEAALFGLPTLDPTQGIEMGSNGETHDQISLDREHGPGLEGEEHDLEPEWAETALAGAAVGGSRHGHPDVGDRGRALYRGGVAVELDTWDEAPLPAEPLDPAEDELRTVVRHVGLDLVLVKEGAAA